MTNYTDTNTDTDTIQVPTDDLSSVILNAIEHVARAEQNVRDQLSWVESATRRVISGLDDGRRHAMNGLGEFQGKADRCDIAIAELEQAKAIAIPMMRLVRAMSEHTDYFAGMVRYYQSKSVAVAKMLDDAAIAL